MEAVIFKALSGIKTHQFGLDSISNNIANVNTNGYRANVAEFTTVFATSLDYINTGGVVSSDFEHGATVGSNAIDTREGSYQSAEDSPFNVAVSGDSWFVVGEDKAGTMQLNAAPAGTGQKNYFTRDGAFKLDGESYIVNNSGQYLYGVDLGKIANDGTFTLANDDTVDTEGLKSTTLSPLRIPDSVNAQPTLTTKADVSVNLSKTENLKGVEEVFYTINSNDPTAVDLKEFDEATFRQNDMNTLFTSAGDHLDLVQNSSMTIDVTKGETTDTYNFIYGEGTDTANTFYFTTVGDFVDKVSTNTGMTVEINPDKTCVFEFKNVTPAGGTAEDMTVLFGTLSDDLRELGITTENRLMDILGITGAETKLEADNEGSVIITESLSVPTFQTDMNVYDDAGTQYLLESVYYLTTYGGDEDVWSIDTLIYSQDKSQILSSDFSHGTMTFDSEGNPTYVDDTTGENTSAVSFGDNTITFNPAGTTDTPSTNRLYKDSALNTSDVDGNAPGFLDKISIDGNGIIYLQFTNNIVEPMGRIGLASFVNDQGLSKVGSNLFEMNYQMLNGESLLISGLPESVWNPNTGDLIANNILQYTIETSNVDFSTALTELIIMQRGYSASSKSFTTGDEMLQEAIGLKR